MRRCDDADAEPKPFSGHVKRRTLLVKRLCQAIIQQHHNSCYDFFFSDHLAFLPFSFQAVIIGDELCDFSCPSPVKARVRLNTVTKLVDCEENVFFLFKSNG